MKHKTPAIRWVLYICILVLALYLIWKTLFLKEGYDTFIPPAGAAEFSRVLNGNQTKISCANMNTNWSNLKVKDLCVKASMNTARTGKYMNLQMIQYVLSRGCRFLDFAVFIKDGKPIVAYSADPDTTGTFDSANSLTLDGVLNTAMGSAFSSSSNAGFMTPNPRDPLFIQLRIQSDLNANTGIFNAVVDSVKKTLKPNLYTNTDKNTTSSLDPIKVSAADIKGKIILIIDGPSGWVKESPSLAGLCNIVANSSKLYSYTTDTLSLMTISPPIVDQTNTMKTNVDVFKLAMPPCDKTNPSKSTFMRNYGTQILAYQMNQTADESLIGYEEMFSKHNAGVMPMAFAVTA